jgi:tetratricopeptide (TPR) repeat protein
MLSVREYKDRVIELERKGEYREAYEILKAALGFYPTNLFLLCNEVYLLFRLKMVKDARELAEGRVEILKNDPFFLKTYLMILERLKAKPDIEEVIERYIFNRRIGDEDLYIFTAKLSERLSGAEMALDVINRGLIYFKDSEKLKEFLSRLKGEESPINRYKYYKEKFEGRRVEDAINEIEGVRALPDYANDHDLLVFLAGLYKKAGDYPKAIDVYKQILTLRDDEFIRRMLGYAYYKTGDFESALVYLKDPFLKNPDDHFLYSALFRIFKERMDKEGFCTLVKEALSTHPSAGHLYGLLKRAEKWGKDYGILLRYRRSSL